jgi:DNA/RNA endonuclease YhcR with UshA esterase domain
MRVKRVAAGATVVYVCLAGGYVSAHHSNAAMYDADKRVVIKGSVTKVQWTNPHSYLYLDVKDASGKVTSWALEGFPPNTLLRTGWKTSMIKTGDTLTVEGAVARDGSSHLLAREVTLPNAQKLYWGPER